MCSYKNLRKSRVIGSLVAAIQKLHEVKVDRMLLCKFQIKNQLSAVFISPHRHLETKPKTCFGGFTI
ncbi:hypothetical protein Hanom_Chr10g00897641 [Helianthus anomalus]